MGKAAASTKRRVQAGGETRLGKPFSASGGIAWIQARGFASLFAWLEETVDGDAEDAEGTLVFEAFGGFVEFLQAQFGVAIEFVVVEELADASFAAIDLSRDRIEIRHERGGFPIESIIGRQLSESA